MKDHTYSPTLYAFIFGKDISHDLWNSTIPQNGNVWNSVSMVLNKNLI